MLNTQPHDDTTQFAQTVSVEVPKPAVVFGSFLDGIRVARGYPSRTVAAKALGMLPSAYNQIVSGSRPGKPTDEQLKLFKTGFEIKGDDLLRFEALLLPAYKNCKFWPDRSIDDEALMALTTISAFISARLKQMGKEPKYLSEALGWTSGKLSTLTTTNMPMHVFDSATIDSMVQELQLNSALSGKLRALNNARPSRTEVFSARVRERDLKPDTSITDKQLLATQSLGQFIILAVKRYGISYAQLQRETYDHKDFFYKITIGKTNYRLSDAMIYRLGDVLGMSAHIRMHVVQLNAARPIAQPRSGRPDGSITKAHVMATQSFDQCIKAKAVQGGISLKNIAEHCVANDALAFTYGNVEKILTQRRICRVDTVLLSVIARFLTMDSEETAHLHALNQQLIDYTRIPVAAKKVMPVSDHQIYATAWLPFYLDLKLSQKGMSYRQCGLDMAAYMGDRRMVDVPKIIYGERADISVAETDAMAHVLGLDKTEAHFLGFLREVYADPNPYVALAQDEDNIFHAFLWHRCPDDYSLEALANDPLMSRWRDSWAQNIDIGFPYDDALRPAKSLMGFSDLDLALLQKMNAARKANIVPSARHIQSVYETSNLFDALMLKVKQANKGLNTLATEVGYNSEYATVILSYGDPMAITKTGAAAFRAHKNKLARGVDAKTLQRLFHVLNIHDVHEQRHLAILNGLLWERYRKKRFDLFQMQESNRPQKGRSLWSLRTHGPVDQPVYTPIHHILAGALPVKKSKSLSKYMSLNA